MAVLPFPNPYTLHLHRTQGSVLTDPRRFKVVVAGRRWGKTRLAKAVALKRVPRASRIWYVAPTWDQARDVFWEELKQGIPPWWLARKPNESRLELVFRNGCRLQLKSAAVPDRLRGRGNDLVIMDEYQDFDPEVYPTIIAPSLLDTNGEALFLGTPKSFNHLYHAFQQGQDPSPTWEQWASWQYRTVDAAKPHGHLDPGMIEQFRQTLDPRTFRQEFEASFETMAGRVYYAFDRKIHVQSVTLRPQVPVVIAVDFNIDPSTALIAQFEGPHVWVLHEVKTRHAGGEATRATARRCKELLANYKGPIRIYGDASGKSGKTTGPSDHAIVREVFPAATWCIPGANPHVRDRIAAVNGRCLTMKGDHYLKVAPECVGLIADLEQVVFEANGDLDKSNLELTHLSDALGYFLAREFPAVVRTFSAANFAA